MRPECGRANREAGRWFSREAGRQGGGDGGVAARVTQNPMTPKPNAASQRTESIGVRTRVAAVATSAAGGLNQPSDPKPVTNMQNSAAITEWALTPATFERTGSEDRWKMDCNPSCRPTAVHAPPAATHTNPAAEQAGSVIVMVLPGERRCTLRCGDDVRAAPMRFRAGSGPLSRSALAGTAERSAAARAKKRIISSKGALRCAGRKR